MNNFKISNLANPANLQDAMTFGLSPTYVGNLNTFITSNWVRMMAITGTEGCVIDVTCGEKNTSGAGSLQFNFILFRTYKGNYSVMLFPWAAGSINTAVNYGEIWMKINFANNNNCICTVRLLNDIGSTTITIDAVSNETTNATDFIDTSGGPDMYFVGKGPQSKNPLMPQLRSNAEFNNAGYNNSSKWIFSGNA